MKGFARTKLAHSQNNVSEEEESYDYDEYATSDVYCDNFNVSHIAMRQGRIVNGSRGFSKA